MARVHPWVWLVSALVVTIPWLLRLLGKQPRGEVLKRWGLFDPPYCRLAPLGQPRWLILLGILVLPNALFGFLLLPNGGHILYRFEEVTIAEALASPMGRPVALAGRATIKEDVEHLEIELWLEEEGAEIKVSGYPKDVREGEVIRLTAITNTDLQGLPFLQAVPSSITGTLFETALVYGVMLILLATIVYWITAFAFKAPRLAILATACNALLLGLAILYPSHFQWGCLLVVIGSGGAALVWWLVLSRLWSLLKS